MQVYKKSGKPFKSTRKVNTVKDTVEHPLLPGVPAFTFVEDDSYVAVKQCKEVP